MSLPIRHLPNILTLIRIVLVLPFIWFMSEAQYDRALWTLLIAGVSDGVDGFLARQFNWRSQFGSIADPVADKTLLVSTFLALALTDNMAWWVVAVIVVRDIGIFIGAIAYWFLVGRYEGRPTFLSKICTFLMIVLGLGVLCNLVWTLIPAVWLTYLSYVVVALCIISMLQYTMLGVQGYRAKQRGTNHHA